VPKLSVTSCADALWQPRASKLKVSNLLIYIFKHKFLKKANFIRKLVTDLISV